MRGQDTSVTPAVLLMHALYSCPVSKVVKGFDLVPKKEASEYSEATVCVPSSSCSLDFFFERNPHQHFVHALQTCTALVSNLTSEGYLERETRTFQADSYAKV